MLTEKEALKTARKGLDFPPFSLDVQEIQPSSKDNTKQPDWIQAVTWEGVTRRFAVTYKSTGGWANLQAAIKQAQETTKSKRGTLPPMVIVPYLRKTALEELVSAQISGLDLCGNGVLYVPGSWFAYRTGNPNRYPDSSPVKSPFRGNQSIVARALLARTTFKNQKELLAYLKEFGTALSTVSKMLAALEQELLVQKKPDIRLMRADALLDRLREDYAAPSTRRTEKLRVGGVESIWKQFNKNITQNDLRYVISAPARYTVLPAAAPTVRVFTNDIDALLDGTEYTPDDRFPTLELIETDSRLPFFDKRFDNDRWWTSPIQEYLDLANGGKREVDAAVAIRKKILEMQ